MTITRYIKIPPNTTKYPLSKNEQKLFILSLNNKLKLKFNEVNVVY